MPEATPAPDTLPSTAELRRICQDPIKGFALRHDGFYRYFSIHLTRQAIRTGLTPHQVTVISLVCGFAAGAVLCVPSLWTSLLALVLLQAYLVLDYVDGELARYRQLASMGGRYLEQAGCYAVDPFILLGMSIGAWRLYGGWLLALGILGALTQIYFRLAPVLVTAVITSVHMGTFDRGKGEATPEPEPTLPPLDAWGHAMGSAYPIYRRLRFPFFHPNFLLLACLALAVDAGLALAIMAPLAAPFMVVAYGVTTPIMTIWQVLNIVHLRIVDERYNAFFLRRESFREHV